MTFKIIWKGEVVEDEIATEQEAMYLLGEYNLAYNGGCSLKRCNRG